MTIKEIADEFAGTSHYDSFMNMLARTATRTVVIPTPREVAKPGRLVAPKGKKRRTGYTRVLTSWKDKGVLQNHRLVYLPAGAIFKCTDENAEFGGMNFESWAVTDYGVKVNTEYSPSSALLVKVSSIHSLSTFEKVYNESDKCSLDPYKWYDIDAGKFLVDLKKERGLM